ncbi:unnamed protein product [Cyprideis torosa]|uniref:Uncharacterized protein n=1 Tax=Cyprideis torosa TaxID=163714 RepID=A0A7R8WKK6_9CRUS|nr:unnamed protein product [Cyprideis torosa]CAG0897204.1 unnamed protein product [Cyprideis torosa]
MILVFPPRIQKIPRFPNTIPPSDSEGYCVQVPYHFHYQDIECPRMILPVGAALSGRYIVFVIQLLRPQVQSEILYFGPASFLVITLPRPRDAIPPPPSEDYRAPVLGQLYSEPEENTKLFLLFVTIPPRPRVPNRFWCPPANRRSIILLHIQTFLISGDITLPPPFSHYPIPSHPKAFFLRRHRFGVPSFPVWNFVTLRKEESCFPGIENQANRYPTWNRQPQTLPSLSSIEEQPPKLLPS